MPKGGEQMDLKERVYSVLIVSAAENFNTVLSELLPESTFSPIITVSNISTAKRTLAERAFDFIIINSPLPDDPGIRFAIDGCAEKGTVVLLFIRAEMHSEIYTKVMGHGVYTLPKPTSKQAITQALFWMASSRERLRKFQKSSLSLEEKMEEIRLVNRAKWLLISELKMDESTAHRYIEKQAMDLCVSKRQIAEKVIQTYS